MGTGIRKLKYSCVLNIRGGANNRGGLANSVKMLKRGGHDKRGGLDNRPIFLIKYCL